MILKNVIAESKPLDTYFWLSFTQNSRRIFMLFRKEGSLVNLLRDFFNEHNQVSVKGANYNVQSLFLSKNEEYHGSFEILR
jgi:hypothetical protein